MRTSFRNILISIFVVIWLGVFHYESLRAIYLNPLFKRELPKIKFLFPPAGWIMFFNVGDSASSVEIYGVDPEGQGQLIDPHDILETRPIGYDNIHRGALSAFISSENRRQACTFLYRKLPYFRNFVVIYVQYPSVSTQPFKQNRFVAYQCQE